MKNIMIVLFSSVLFLSACGNTSASTSSIIDPNDPEGTFASLKDIFDIDQKVETVTSGTPGDMYNIYQIDDSISVYSDFDNENINYIELLNVSEDNTETILSSLSSIESEDLIILVNKISSGNEDDLFDVSISLDSEFYPE